MTRTGQAEAGHDPLFLEALARRRVTVLFQPLLDLSTGQVIGHEALSRGPAGTRLEAPGGLFAAARAAGRTAELDWACRCTAFRDALRSRRCPSWRLFVNAEPETLGSACPVDLVPDWLRAHRSLRVVVELTERSLLRRPAQLLQVVTTLRELGWEIALDDVGANEDGVALLPVVQPDVVKLDATLLSDRLDAGQRATLRAVEAWRARSAVAVVAEGIETEAHLRRAGELGATWGQGFLLGRPSPFGLVPADGSALVRRTRCSPRPSDEESLWATPFDLAPGRPERADVAALHDALRSVRALARRSPASALVLVALGDRVPLPERLMGWLRELDGHCSLVSLYGTGLPDDLDTGLRTTRLSPTDPLAGQVAAVVLGPDVALMVAGRPRPDGGLDLVRSTDPSRVARGARALLARTAPLPPEDEAWDEGPGPAA